MAMRSAIILALLIQQIAVISAAIADCRAPAAAEAVVACCAIDCFCGEGCTCAAESAPGPILPSEAPPPRPAPQWRDIVAAAPVDVTAMTWPDAPAAQRPRASTASARTATGRLRPQLCVWTT